MAEREDLEMESGAGPDDAAEHRKQGNQERTSSRTEQIRHRPQIQLHQLVRGSGRYRAGTRRQARDSCHPADGAPAHAVGFWIETRARLSDLDAFVQGHASSVLACDFFVTVTDG